MKAILNLALLAAAATTAASAAAMSNNNHHREKRAPGPPGWPLKVAKLAALAYGSGGSGASPLPPHIDPNVGMSTMKFHEMPIEASFSGPLATMGVLAILTSALMAANYFQAVNAQRRAGYGGQYIQKRSTFDVDPDAIVSLINSFR